MWSSCRTPLAAALLLALAGGRPSHTTAQSIPRLTDSARVSLISILPGDDVYSVFGHSTLRVRDPQLGIDRSYNFGTFDFGESPLAMASFVARFTYGDLNYSLTVQDPQATIPWYWEELGRASIEQTLALTPAEARELFRRLEINARPENRYYQYDFFFDNCATRILDALEAVLGPGLAFDVEPPGRSFRQLLDPFLTGAPWLDLGMDLGLGLPADREATAREATFLPEHLMRYVAAGRMDRDGRSQPLVRRTEQLTGPAGVSWRPPTAPPWPEIAGWVLLAVGTFVTLRDARTGRRVHRVADPVFFGALGVAGLAVAFLWFISLHRVTDLNLNLAWALPTHLVLAVLLAREGHDAGTSRGAASGTRDGTRRGAGLGVRLYLAATAGLAGLLLLGMPIWPQELPAALVPLLLLIVTRAGWLAWVRRRPGTAGAGASG